MMFTTEMIQLFAVVLGKDCNSVTQALLREGVMQFINTSEIQSKESENFSTVISQRPLDEISDLRKQVEGFLHSVNIIPETPVETDLNNHVPVDMQKEKENLDKMTLEREIIRDKQRKINQEILKIEDIKRQIELYGTTITDVGRLSKNSLISIQAGQLPLTSIKQLEDDLKEFPSVNIPVGQSDNEAFHIVISMRRDSEQITNILEKAGWTRTELQDQKISVEKNVSAELSGKLKKLTQQQLTLETQARELVNEQAGHLKKVWSNLRVTELICRIQTNFTSSARTVLFTGWLPLSKKDRLTEAINKACSDRCYLEWNEPGSVDTTNEEIPVQLNNPKILEPFQMLVTNFGIPKYGTIDPTSFVMPIYLAMFGLMFADVGHGLVLTIMGILGMGFLKNKKEKRGLYNLSWLIIWCGCSAMLFGTLFGSVFGMSFFKPLWFDFHGIVSGHTRGSSPIHDVFDILIITIYFGISVISIGLLFNWVNLIRTRQWMQLFFDKGGILGGWMYGGGIYIAYYLVVHDYRDFPPGEIIFILTGLPALLMFIKEPWHYFEHAKHLSPNKPNSLSVFLNFVMEWIVELLEIFSGYLSNTLSFMRIAGLGIAHVCLMISFFSLADMTSGIGSVLILVLGNILVIGLEGLSAGIQALRLSYYEFFTKFFHGTGKLYVPISLNSSFR